ncbi:MAG: FKBP-type peptidyl-prolyl cis-trans isomerase [Bacteroidia bacterium]|jgi:FKBP-type peptidyl-prolyl cis-trans isomerase FkpA
MKRFLKACMFVALISFLASCKKDDDNAAAPPRDFHEQYASEKDSILKYLKTHYIKSVDAEFNIELDSITATNPHTSIWDQTEYPLDSITVNLSRLVAYKDTKNTVDYKVYYIKLNQGGGIKPTRGDNMLVAYRGTRLDDTQFDYNPYPQSLFSMAGVVEGWQEVLQLFNGGIYVDEPNSPNPARYTNYGAGVMFIPSGLGYYNQVSGNLGSYQSMVFTFKMYQVQYGDLDNDGIESRYENDPADPTKDLGMVDTDGDNIPDYLDADDDGDGVATRYEIRIPNTTPIQYYTFDNIPTCTGGTRKKHLDPACY